MNIKVFTATMNSRKYVAMVTSMKRTQMIVGKVFNEATAVMDSNLPDISRIS